MVVHEYGRRVEAWQLENDNFSEISAKVKRLIKAYKYKYILNWNTAVVQEVFKSNDFLIKTMSVLLCCSSTMKVSLTMHTPATKTSSADGMKIHIITNPLSSQSLIFRSRPTKLSN